MRPPYELLIPMPCGDHRGKLIDPLIERTDEANVFANLLHAPHEFGTAHERNEWTFDFSARARGDLSRRFFLCSRHIRIAESRHALGGDGKCHLYARLSCVCGHSNFPLCDRCNLTVIIIEVINPLMSIA